MTVMERSPKMLTTHPLAEKFPSAAKGPAFDELLNDIRKKGQTDPILLYEGKILDGRARYRACAILGIQPKFETWTADLHGDPVYCLTNRNLWRRKLSPEALAFLAESYATRGRGGAAANGKDMNQAQAASLFGVSRSYMESARAIRQYAPELEAKVLTGELSITSAERVAKKEITLADLDGPRGNPVRLPDEYETLEEALRAGMALESELGSSALRIATRVGINVDAYRRGRQLILLADNPDKLAPGDRELVRKAIAFMNESGRLADAMRMVDDITKNIFGDGERVLAEFAGTRRQKRRRVRESTLEERIATFEESIEHVLGVCRSTGHLEVPYLPPKRAGEILRELKQAQGDLGDLAKKLKEICKC